MNSFLGSSLSPHIINQSLAVPANAYYRQAQNVPDFETQWQSFPIRVNFAWDKVAPFHPRVQARSHEKLDETCRSQSPGTLWTRSLSFTSVTPGGSAGVPVVLWPSHSGAVMHLWYDRICQKGNSVCRYDVDFIWQNAPLLALPQEAGLDEVESRPADDIPYGNYDWVSRMRRTWSLSLKRDGCESVGLKATCGVEPFHITRLPRKMTLVIFVTDMVIHLLELFFCWLIQSDYPL